MFSLKMGPGRAGPGLKFVFPNRAGSGLKFRPGSNSDDEIQSTAFTRYEGDESYNLQMTILRKTQTVLIH